MPLVTTRARGVLLLILTVLGSACNNPTSPERTFFLSGMIRDASSSRPVADATVQVTTGSLAGRATTSDSLGQFHFTELASSAEPTTLTVLKFGYSPATVQVQRTDVVITLSSSRLPIEGDYTMIFAAANECDMLPSALRRRAYAAAIVVSRRFTSSLDGLFDIELSGADFFPELRTISLSISSGRSNVFIGSSEADRKWGDDIPIYERVRAGEHLSLHGRAEGNVSVTDTALTQTFDGVIAFCPRSTAPFADGYPPQCAMPPIECRSDHHQLTASRR